MQRRGHSTSGVARKRGGQEGNGGRRFGLKTMQGFIDRKGFQTAIPVEDPSAKARPIRRREGLAATKARATIVFESTTDRIDCN
eukprot:scaffold754_cov289-Pavlova_lutheri.AAC.4